LGTFSLRDWSAGRGIEPAPAEATFRRCIAARETSLSLDPWSKEPSLPLASLDRYFGTGFDQREISALPLEPHRPGLLASWTETRELRLPWTLHLGDFSSPKNPRPELRAPGPAWRRWRPTGSARNGRGARLG